MEIHCKTCGSVVPARNIDLNGQIAKCEKCNSVFNCMDELSSISFVKREERQLPDMMKVTRDRSGLNIVRRWFSPKYKFLVNLRSITIRHGPMPGWGNKDIDPAQLKQLYSREFIRHSRRGGRDRSYELHAETKSGKDIKLLADIANKEQALYIEQEIEKYLNIKDQLVEDEIPRWP